ncbi:MAG: hypothetical protein ABW163_02270, partial [Luteimonas sp.]
YAFWKAASCVSSASTTLADSDGTRSDEHAAGITSNIAMHTRGTQSGTRLCNAPGLHSVRDGNLARITTSHLESPCVRTALTITLDAPAVLRLQGRETGVTRHTTARVITGIGLRLRIVFLGIHGVAHRRLRQRGKPVPHAELLRRGTIPLRNCKGGYQQAQRGTCHTQATAYLVVWISPHDTLLHSANTSRW